MMKEREGRRERNWQGIGVLDISFQHFQGVLERPAHGSYVHPPTPKRKSLNFQSKPKEKTKKEKKEEKNQTEKEKWVRPPKNSDQSFILYYHSLSFSLSVIWMDEFNSR